MNRQNYLLHSITNFDETETYYIVQGVAVKIIQQIFKEGKSLSLLDEGKLNAAELFNSAFNYTLLDLKVPYEATQDDKYLHLGVKLLRDKEAIRSKVVQYLRTKQVVTEEGDKEGQDDYGANNSESYLQDVLHWDGKRNAPASIKILLSTIAQSRWKDQAQQIVEYDRHPGTYMIRMINASQFFNQTYQELAPLNSAEEKVARILELAAENPHYKILATRLKLGHPAEALSAEDYQLRIKFYNTFSRQRPTATKILHTEEESVLQELNASDTQKRLITDWVDSIKSTMGYFDEASHTYKINTAALKKDIRSDKDKLDFLNTLGIAFPQDLSLIKDRDKWAEAVTSIWYVLQKNPVLTVNNAKSLGLYSALNKLAGYYIKATGQVPEATFMSLEGTRVTEFVQKNTVATFINDINNATSLEDLYRRLPHLAMPYAQGSLYVNQETVGQPLFTISYLSGVEDEGADTKTPTAKLSEGQRLLSELNANLNDTFYTLVPADSKLEWTVQKKPRYPYATLTQPDFWTGVVEDFNGYYRVEKALFESDGKDRIFSLLAPGYTKDSLTKEDLTKFIRTQLEAQKAVLQGEKILQENGDGTYRFSGLDTHFTRDHKMNRESLTKAELDTVLSYTTLNDMVHTVEMHKLFFGDPAAYGKLSNMLKRYKSWLSPRESSYYDPAFNTLATQTYNKSGAVALQPGDFGYHQWKDHLDTITWADVEAYIPSIAEDKHLPDNITESYQNSNGADAQSWAPPASYQEIKTKRQEWSEADEEQMQYIRAEDRQLMYQDGLLTDATYRKELQQADKALVAKGDPHASSFPPLKPVGTGYTLDNQPFLDKTSVTLITYRVARGRNMAAHYQAMVEQDISYAIVESGRKVGAGTKNTFYSEEGSPNTNYTGIVRVPFKYYGIQTETEGEHNQNIVGSQAAKLDKVNIYEGGVPTDFEVEEDGKRRKGTAEEWFALSPQEQLQQSKRHAAAQHSIEMRRELSRIGYAQLLQKLGIEEIEQDGQKVLVVNKQQLTQLLQDELFHREVSDNMQEALSYNPQTGDFTFPLETLTNYTQIRGILYSYVNKLVSKPSVNGGPRIQVSGAGMEVVGHREKKALINGKEVWISDGLKMYEATYDENGKRTSVGRMEVLLPNPFAKKLRAAKLSMNDDELLAYLNNTAEGKRILSGIGFRIPTQEMNSIDCFTIAGFLPEYMGDTVVVPEALTTKAGSDFDVDKLNTYIKNIYITSDKKIKLVPFFGVDEEARAKLKKLLQEDQLRTFFDLSKTQDKDALEELSAEQLSKEEVAAARFLDKLYQQSIQNEYFEAMEALILHPDNFERLVKPNNADALKAVADILEKLAPAEFGFPGEQSILSRTFRNKMRQEFTLSKDWVGIIALHSTAHTLCQKGGVFLDTARTARLAEEKQEVLRGAILLLHNTLTLHGNSYASVAHAKDMQGEYISDKISKKIDAAKGAWLSKIIQDTDALHIHLALDRLGVPEEIGAYFLNQPIIREYKKLWRNKTDKEYREDIEAQVKAKFGGIEQKDVPADFEGKENTADFSEQLQSVIHKYYTGQPLTQKEKAEQWLVLKEYFKYEAIANHLDKLNKAVTYDTTSFNDPNVYDYLAYHSEKQQSENIFSSVNNILQSSFLGEIKTQVGNAMDTVARSVFTLDHPDIRSYLNPVLNELKGYIRSTENYLIAARKAEQSFIQYLLQEANKLNTLLPSLLRDKETAITTELARMDIAFKENLVIKALRISTGNTPQATKNVALLSKVYNIFTAYQYIGALRELRDNPHTSSFYQQLVQAALLQAGITSQSNSLIDLIPYEDYQKYIYPLLQSLTNKELLESFHVTGAFYKNNWSNTDIVPRIKEKWVERKSGWYIANQISPAGLQQAGIPFAYKIDSRSVAFHAPYITVQRDKPGFTKEQKKQMKKNGDYSYKETMLLRRIEENGKPLLQFHNPEKPWYGVYATYVPDFALGDRNRAQEYYRDNRPTVLENHTYQPKVVLSKEQLVAALRK